MWRLCDSARNWRGELTEGDTHGGRRLWVAAAGSGDGRNPLCCRRFVGERGIRKLLDGRLSRVVPASPRTWNDASQ